MPGKSTDEVWQLLSTRPGWEECARRATVATFGSYWTRLSFAGATLSYYLNLYWLVISLADVK